ncbi:cupin domain-containing protein [Methylobacterium planeticum]|uniref:Cupin domain-containing protein n=1 Tax=Methylobacterium planeticum TaxID=2615211 RepID=A0A6N6MM08_9HYPH|nr:cupin domain-containing protein [Methylobacterium planeticum]KAB1069322.1 cupin domain-containing protein [Methylobacterium planeticum]
MITRRGFTACAICAAVSSAGFLATEAGAQPSPSGTSPIKRNTLSKTDVPGGNMIAILMTVDVPAGVDVPRHTHPGIESTYVLEGEAELYVQGQPDMKLMPSGAFQVPPEVPHGIRNVAKPMKLSITYIVDKDKPLLTLAPA